jgi:RNA polymerase sigma-70 factor (ECF subfamily)
MNTSDHELLRRAGLGDATAFESLVRRWEAPVGRILTRLVTNTSEVDDLRQEVFMRVLLASRRYEPKFAFSTWLYRIVLNLARDAARRHKRTVESLDNCQPVDGNADPHSSASRRETAEVVESALAALPDRLREVLVLRHYTDLTFDRIAEVLNEPTSTVKSRTKLALEKLHTELRRRGLTNGEV